MQRNRFIAFAFSMAAAMLIASSAFGQCREVKMREVADAQLNVIMAELTANYNNAPFTKIYAVDSYGGGQSTPSSNVLECVKEYDRSVRIDENNNELGILFGATSNEAFRKLFTHGSQNMDDLLQHGLRKARQDALLSGLIHTVAASRSMPNDFRGIYYVIIRLPKNAYNPKRTDYVFQPEFKDSLAALRNSLGPLTTQLNRHELTINNHEARISDLEQTAIRKKDIGFSAGLGLSFYSLDGYNFHGPTIHFAYRYYDMMIEGFGGQTFNRKTSFENYAGQLLPKFSDKHFEGGTIYWAPLQEGRWGHYWRVGATGFHAQTFNLDNDSRVQAWFGGGTASIAYPWPFVTPEAWGTLGYSLINESADSYGETQHKTRGFGGGFGFRLTAGYR